MHILPSLCLILIKNALCVFYVAYIWYIPSLCYNNHVLHLLHVLYHKQWLVFCQMALFSLGEGQDGTCPPSMFLCDTNRCLPTSWRCDWEIDCSDMSDELDCCKFWVREVIFWMGYVVNLEFTLNRNSLSHFSARIHADILHVCTFTCTLTCTLYCT